MPKPMSKTPVIICMMARNLAILAAFEELATMLSQVCGINTEKTKMHNLILCCVINDADYDELEFRHTILSTVRTDMIGEVQTCLNFPKSSCPQQDRSKFFRSIL